VSPFQGFGSLATRAHPGLRFSPSGFSVGLGYYLPRLRCWCTTSNFSHLSSGASGGETACGNSGRWPHWIWDLVFRISPWAQRRGVGVALPGLRLFGNTCPPRAPVQPFGLLRRPGLLPAAPPVLMHHFELLTSQFRCLRWWNSLREFRQVASLDLRFGV